MASPRCLNCLSRPQLSSSVNSRISLPACAFSTSSHLLATAAAKRPPTKGAAKGAPVRTHAPRTFTVKKKPPPAKTGKPPGIGERKAMRKRIVLSNTNALVVSGLKDLEAEMLEDETMIGTVVGLKGETVDGLRASEAFKTTQGWGLFRRPAVLVRTENVEVARMMGQAEREKGVVRLVVDGQKGAGKSLMLVNAMAAALVKGWVVLNIPEAQDLTNAVTEYSPIPDTKPTLYSQNTYTAAWLSKIAKANQKMLDSMQVTKEHTLPIPLQANISLTRLCELGARDTDIAWPIFQAFWAEITSEGRPPVLLAMDGLQFAMQMSLYRSAAYELIHAHDLAIIRLFMDLLSGASPLPNGGAVIAATNRSHAPASKSTTLAVIRADERSLGLPLSLPDPYEKTYDARADEVLKDVEGLRLKGISKHEARGLMEYWAKSGVLRSLVDERSVAERWALAGNGVVGEIERGALKMRI